MANKHISKLSTKIKFKRGINKPKVISDIKKLQNLELKYKEKIASENLLRIYESSIKSKAESNYTFPTSEYFERILKCENCNSKPDVELVSALILYINSGDYTYLTKYYEKKLYNMVCQLDDDSSCIEYPEEDISASHVSITSEKKETETLGSRRSAKRKAAIPEVDERSKNIDSANEIDVANQKKKRKIVTATKNGVKSSKNDDKYLFRLSVDNQTNIKIVPTLKKNYKIKARDNLIKKEEANLYNDSLIVNSQEDEANNKIEKDKIENNLNDPTRIVTLDEKGEIKMTKINKRNKRKNLKKDFSCDLCGSKFTSKNGLNYHIRFVHSDDKINIVKPFNCPIKSCRKKYKNKNGLNYHLAHNHPENTE